MNNCNEKLKMIEIPLNTNPPIQKKYDDING